MNILALKISSEKRVLILWLANRRDYTSKTINYVNFKSDEKWSSSFDIVLVQQWKMKGR